MVRLIISHAVLRSALRLVLRLHVAEDAGDAGCPRRNDVVVTTAADTSPAACRALAERGVRVVILTPVLDRAEKARYLLAGAAHCLEMTADTTALVEAVRTAASPGALLDAS